VGGGGEAGRGRSPWDALSSFPSPSRYRSLSRSLSVSRDVYFLLARARAFIRCGGFRAGASMQCQADAARRLHRVGTHPGRRGAPVRVKV
jgi:hypothetical protein